ncbi:MBL fold metallo-hydrolase [Spirochaetia bacterium]|nr:MBL fold metallo-hydrolase [Spirochaetia bacterium]
MFSIRFWGVRGSIPCPGPETAVFGGNTTCLEIRADSKLIIIDFGTGIRKLGAAIMADDSKKGPLDMDIFLTHTHLDHLQGFHFFAPLFIPTSKIRIHGPFLPSGENLEDIFSNLTNYNYWPIRLQELSAKITFQQICEKTLHIGDVEITSKYLNHPVICLGYRFEYKGKTIVVASDSEPFWNPFAAEKNNPLYDVIADKAGEKTVTEENKKLLTFMKNADILVYDSAYTEQEYASSRLNWGHTSFETAIATASKAAAKKLVLFHHDPVRTDKVLSEFEKKYCGNYNGMEVMMAKENLVLEA